MKIQFNRIAAIALAALFAAGTAAAKNEGKQEEKAEKHERKAEKHERKAEKHERKAEKHEAKEEKQQRKAQRKVEDVRVGAYFDDRHREHARRYYSDYYRDNRRCPPGLAKKNNGCMPPGQAKKWNVGEPLPRGVAVYEVPRPVLVQLPPAPYGYHYARVGGDIVLVRNNNNLVIDIIVNVFG